MNEKIGICWFCNQSGELIAPAGEDGIIYDLFMCNNCKSLLQKKETAMPLLRGRLVQENAGNSTITKKRIDLFMKIISTWNLKN